MSETKRANLTTLNSNKSDKKPVTTPKKTVRLDLNLIEPNEDECSVFNFTALIKSLEKKQLKKKNSAEGKVNGIADPFGEDDEEEVERIARQFEEKYGDKNRCYSYRELGAGYDENDSFIDNTENCDEALSHEYQTDHGGYYVHSGPLTLKRVQLCDDDGPPDAGDEVRGKRRKGGPNVIGDDSEEDEDEEDEEDDDEDEDEDEEDEEEEEETTEKETDVSEKNEEKQPEKEVEKTVTVKKMKLDKTDDCTEIATKSEDMEDAAALAKKRKKAEKRHHNHNSDHNHHHHKNHKHHRKDVEEKVEPVATNNVNSTVVDNETVVNNGMAENMSNGRTHEGKEKENMKEKEKMREKKKKNATVKALLEEKRLQQTEPLKVAETVNLDSDLSQSSHSTDDTAKESQAAATGVVTGSAGVNRSAAEAPTLPAEMSELIARVKLAMNQSHFSKRNFSPEVNTLLMSLEMKMQTVSSVIRTLIYEHLAFFLPCSKQTLTKRMKKLCCDFEEEKMAEPLKKLKAAVDATMPALLEKYFKDCQKVAAEKAAAASTEENGTGEKPEESTNPRLPRRKFIWTNEMRSYVKEVIRLRLVCYNIKNPRRESSDIFLRTFLDSQVQPLWPPGWMKTSILIREAESSTVQSLRKIRKHQSPSQQQQQQQQQQQLLQQQQLQHQQLQAHMQSIITQQLQQQTPQPLQSLLNVSLPSSTTLTPTNGGATSSFKLTPDHHLEKKTKKSSPLTVSTTSPSTAVPVISPTNGLTISRVISPHAGGGASKVPPSPSPPKRQSLSPSTSPFAIKSITMNGGGASAYRDFAPNSNNSNSGANNTPPGGGNNQFSNSTDSVKKQLKYGGDVSVKVDDGDNSILDLSSPSSGARSELSSPSVPTKAQQKCVSGYVGSSDRTTPSVIARSSDEALSIVVTSQSLATPLKASPPITSVEAKTPPISVHLSPNVS